ncbi:MAG: rhodanese-like domain-containing protein [Chitinophagaceae bacterium]|nr:rhodanese-like domain-containing protein [Chitinophagaceae bacterium]
MSWLSDLSRLISGNAGVRQALRDGGVVIDLRTAYEFDQGHVPGALNIPIDRIKANIARIRDLRRPVILCCSAGAHCREGIEILRNAGITQVHNGGDWQSLWRVIKNA